MKIHFHYIIQNLICILIPLKSKNCNIRSKCLFNFNIKLYFKYNIGTLATVPKDYGFLSFILSNDNSYIFGIRAHQ